jgi:hypothetical protein
LDILEIYRLAALVKAKFIWPEFRFSMLPPNKFGGYIGFAQKCPVVRPQTLPGMDFFEAAYGDRVRGWRTCGDAG